MAWKHDGDIISLRNINTCLGSVLTAGFLQQLPLSVLHTPALIRADLHTTSSATSSKYLDLRLPGLWVVFLLKKLLSMSVLIFSIKCKSNWCNAFFCAMQCTINIVYKLSVEKLLLRNKTRDELFTASNTTLPYLLDLSANSKAFGVILFSVYFQKDKL